MENISKLLVCLDTGKTVGYILDVALDDMGFMKKGYYIADEETEEEWFISKKDIIGVSADYVIIENLSKLEFVAEREHSLIGRIVLGENFENLGAVQSLIFKREKLEKLVTDKCEVTIKYVKKIGKNFIFLSFKRKTKMKRQDVFKEISNQLVQIQTTAFPEKVRLSTSYYLGKVVQHDIFGYNNERIISKGDKISKNVVEKAKLHNKLNQLYFAIER